MFRIGKQKRERNTRSTKDTRRNPYLASCAFCASCVPSLASPGDSRNNGEFSPVRNRCGEVFQKPYIFAVDINIDEAAERAGFVANAGAKAGIFRVEVVEYLLDGGGFDFNRLRAGCELS